MPQILQASRKKRIAAGAGLEVSELNKLAQDAAPNGRYDEKNGQDG